MKQSIAMEMLQAMHQFTKLKMNNLMDEYTLREEQLMMTMGQAKHMLKMSEVPVSYVCEKMNMSSASASRMFRSLEEKNIIVRKSAKENKRNTVLMLTEYGISQCKELHKRGEIFWMKILEQIEEERIVEMIELLDEIYLKAKTELEKQEEKEGD
ncbi:MAG: MarR family transcriptional regulator [Eubacterium sp.]|nr:MarR family transcriptional regulator [Eubacterium sp.]